MKKQLLAGALSLALLVGLVPAAGADSTQQAQQAAEHLYCLGLLDGAGTGSDGMPNFNLGGTMTRGEAITMVVRLTGGKEAALTGGSTHPFTDVDGWGEPYVAYAYANGITTGVSDTAFGFHSTITQEEYLTLLLRAMRYDGVDWRDPYAAADRLGLREGEDYVRDHTFQRGDMVLLSDRMLEVTLAGEEVTLYEKLDLQGALERRELPVPKLQPGPTVTVESTFAVSSVEDMIRRMAVQVDARNTALTIYTPVGQEGAYSQALLTKDTIDRFPDVDSMATRYYPDQGYFTVEISYRDSARVMAYVEGKTDRLSAQDMALYEEAVRVHDSLVDSTMSQYERVKAFHDYLCDTVTYRKTGPESHTAYGALVNHAAVCQGYTQAMDLLCFLSGIDCEHIFGQATANGVTEYHAWVRVNIDGNWYNVDPTWDDQVTYISYDYFLVSDGHMDGHIWTAYPNWPVCPSDYPRP